METNFVYSVATLLDVRYKGYFFRNNLAKEDARNKLVELVNQESQYLPQELTEVINEEDIDDPDPVNPPLSLLASAFERIRQKSGSKQTQRDKGPNDSIPSIIDNLLSQPCERDGNLKWWEQYELNAKAKDDKARLAVCSVARKYLTPPPSSVNVERLFSSAGQVMDEKRARLKPENLDKILFLRENSIVNNFRLDW